MPKGSKPRLTSMERAGIRSALDAGESVAQIARAIGRPAKTVAREIKARRVSQIPHIPYRVTNICEHANACVRANICHVCDNRKARSCSLCRNCNQCCPAFSERVCPALNRSPFVCNGCPSQKSCARFRRQYYEEGLAQQKYETILSESRRGANITEGVLGITAVPDGEITRKSSLLGITQQIKGDILGGDNMKK